jgi:hypothetical protein
VNVLDNAAERMFLRKMGGGYTFIHRQLQDDFAALHTKSRNGAHQDASR